MYTFMSAMVKSCEHIMLAKKCPHMQQTRTFTVSVMSSDRLTPVGLIRLNVLKMEPPKKLSASTAQTLFWPLKLDL